MQRVRDKRNIRNVVFNILHEDEKARNSDRYLYIKVLDLYVPGLSERPFGEVLMSNEAPSPETVRRSRQWCQEKFPSLRPSHIISAYRKLQEEEYKEVFK